MAGIAEQLRQAVLQAAIQGKLTEQLPEDGDAKDLLAEIQTEKAKLITEKRTKKEKPLELISEDETPFDIPENWKWTRLPEIATSCLGKTLNKNTDVGEDKAYLCSINVYWTGIDLNNVKHAKFSTNDISKYRLQDGDLLICEGGDIGRAAIWHGNSEMYYQNALHRVRFYGNISQQYFLYVLMLLKRNGTLENVSKGMTIKHLVQESLYSIIFPIPPLAEQHRIVARVDELMAKIDELEKVENELNALHKAFPGDMKAALLQAAMQGKLTEQLREDGNVDELLLAIEKERNELIAKKEIKKDDLENLTDIPFDVPESWRWVKLNNIVIKNIKRGKSPTYAPNSHILVFAQKCNTKAGYINMDLALFLDEDKAKKYPNSEYMQDADTVINSTGNGTLGRVGFYRESDNPRHFPVVPDSHVTVVRTSSKLNKKYVMYCLKYFQPYFEKKCTGSTNQTELGVDIVKNLPFPVPPIKEQQRIVEKLDKLLPLCDSLEEKL